MKSHLSAGLGLVPLFDWDFDWFRKSSVGPFEMVFATMLLLLPGDLCLKGRFQALNIICFDFLFLVHVNVISIP